MLSISEIKLIRTDTTLDLSQKAEKVCFPKRDTLSYILFDYNILYYGTLTILRPPRPQKKPKNPRNPGFSGPGPPGLPRAPILCTLRVGLLRHVTLVC